MTTLSGRCIKVHMTRALSLTGHPRAYMSLCDPTMVDMMLVKIWQSVTLLGADWRLILLTHGPITTFEHQFELGQSIRCIRRRAAERAVPFFWCAAT